MWIASSHSETSAGLHTLRVVIIYRTSLEGDLPVSVATKLVGERSLQPCASSGRRLIEADTAEAVVPISPVLPDCDFEGLENGIYFLQITVSYSAGGIGKTIARRSDNGLIVENGSVIGATKT